MHNVRRSDYRTNATMVKQAVQSINKKQGRGGGLTDVSIATGLSRSTVLRHLRNMEALGVVVPVSYRYRNGMTCQRWYIKSEAKDAGSLWQLPGFENVS